MTRTAAARGAATRDLDRADARGAVLAERCALRGVADGVADRVADRVAGSAAGEVGDVERVSASAIAGAANDSPAAKHAVATAALILVIDIGRPRFPRCARTL